jgi:hypothetical protein
LHTSARSTSVNGSGNGIWGMWIVWSAAKWYLHSNDFDVGVMFTSCWLLVIVNMQHFTQKRANLAEFWLPFLCTFKATRLFNQIDTKNLCFSILFLCIFVRHNPEKTLFVLQRALFYCYIIHSRDNSNLH